MKRFQYDLKLTLIEVFIALVVFTAPLCAEDNIKFEIRLDKYTILEREPIWVDMYLINESNESVTLKCLELYWQMLTVYLVNSAGDTVKYSGYVTDGIPPRGPNIRPGETYTYSINLSENFGKGFRDYIPPPLRYLAKDAYTLQMVHNKVFSNKIEFTVTEATGSEKNACDLIKNATRSGFKYYHDDVHQVIDIFEELLKKYPNSVYADLAQNELAGLYGLVREIGKTTYYLKTLVLTQPNSHFVHKAIPRLLRQMEDPEKKMFLEEVIKKVPDSRASNLAKETLNNIEGR
jgi:hypothetical protein